MLKNKNLNFEIDDYKFNVIFSDCLKLRMIIKKPQYYVMLC